MSISEPPPRTQRSTAAASSSVNADGSSPATRLPVALTITSTSASISDASVNGPVRPETR